MKLLIKIFFIFAFFIVIFTQKSYAETDTLIILDASTSMNYSFKDESRFAYAIKAMEEILAKYNDFDKIGLRVINFSFKDLDSLLKKKLEFCKNTSLIVPIQRYSKNEILNEVKQMNVLGMSTPLEYTLKSAIENDFSISENLKHIILITDGGENCDGNPCKYINDISKIRSDIVIDVIAISKSNEQDKRLFNCITSSTNGLYINVESVDDFEPAIRSFVNSSTSDISPQNQYSTDKQNIIYKEYVMEF